MSVEFSVLAGTAVSIGFIHTLLGPDHYIPFIALAKARRWSSFKTSLITLVCGLGHVLSSIFLGLIGIAAGTAIFKLESVESFRGELAAWLLIAFGFTYFVWGIHRAVRNKPHTHTHIHEDGDAHNHSHSHSGEHSHIHDSNSSNLTPWVLFIVFILGPCEPLIPLVMYPASKGSYLTVITISGIFALTTIATMLVIVTAGYYGLVNIKVQRFEKYMHALAGLTILLCGGAIKFLGL